jgi:hypothetical protein
MGAGARTSGALFLAASADETETERAATAMNAAILVIISSLKNSAPATLAD